MLLCQKVVHLAHWKKAIRVCMNTLGAIFDRLGRIYNAWQNILYGVASDMWKLCYLIVVTQKRVP